MCTGLWQGEGIEALLRTADLEAAAVESSALYNLGNSLRHTCVNILSVAVARDSR